MEFDSLVLAAATADLAVERAAREHADAIEFRMDLAERPLDALAAYGEAEAALPMIATNRADWEGGEADTGGEAAKERLDALHTAAEHPRVEAIDVELRTAREEEGANLIEHARANDASVIVSTHDFEATPGREQLRDTLRRACEHGDVGKLAVTAHDTGDVLDLLAVTHDLATGGRRVATMAMGQAGRHSRAVAPVYGSKIGYAPVDPADATAPGQYDLATLADLIERMA